MEITITVDFGSVKRGLHKVTKSRVFVGTAAVLLLGLSGYAYGIGETPTHVFEPGKAISSSEVNSNFRELFAAANAAETDIDTVEEEVVGLGTGVTSLNGEVGTLQSSVAGLNTAVNSLQDKSIANSCNWRYQFGSATNVELLCPNGQFVMSGSCSVIGSVALTGSSPTGLGGGTDTVTKGTGWRCKMASSAAVDVRALCCTP